MCDERRKNARTQGKFSSPKELHPSRRDKQSELKSMQNQNSSDNNEDGMKSRVSKSRAADGIEIEYQEKSSYSFKELSDKKPMEEIRSKGVHELSKTKNGTSRIIYEPNFLSAGEAQEFMTILRDATKWHEKNIIIRGQEYPQPRLVAWYGPFAYKYSGAVLDQAEMPNSVVHIKQKVEAFLLQHDLCVDLNSVLLNYYRNGKDSVSWHSDDEMEMGVHPTIASISLGEVRAFQMRPKRHVENIDPDTILYVNLLPGSLLIMDGCMQRDWMHQVPKEYHDKGQRINLTFRTVYAIDRIPTQVPSTIEISEPIYHSKVTPPNPVYDSENFPPLMPASNSKSNVSNKRNSESKTLNPTPHKEDIVVNNKIAASEESETNPNEDENKNFSLLSRNADSPLLRDSTKHILDTKESSNSELSPLNELVNNSSAEEQERGKPDGDLDYLCPENEVKSSVKNSVQEYTEDNLEAGCTGGNKYTLNVNAPDFVPGSLFSDSVYLATGFDGFSLKELAEFYESDTETVDSQDFLNALMSGLRDAQRDRDIFSLRDWKELEVYIQLTEAGQNDENQKVVNMRICSMIKNAVYQQDNRPFDRKQKIYTQRTRGRSNYRGRNPRY